MKLQGARGRLLGSTRSGINDKRGVAGMSDIPRDFSVQQERRQADYAERPLPIGLEQTISQPFIIALMTEALELTGSEKILEVGTGSGYQAAILSQLVRRVYTVDRDRRPVTEAKALFETLDLSNFTPFTADGSHGLPDQAPFEKTLVTAAAQHPPGARWA